jgi:hypothetical protein
MIRHKSKKINLYNSEKACDDYSPLQLLFFSDTPNTCSNEHRFIGIANSAEVNICMEEAFLKVACVIDRSMTVSQMTATVKQPTMPFPDIAFDLIRIHKAQGEIQILEDSIILSVTVPETNVTHKYSAYTKSCSFSPVLLNRGDLLAIRVDPGPNNTSAFGVSVSVS